MKLNMAIAQSQAAWITSKAHGKTELNVNRLTATLFNNLRARLQHVTQAIYATKGMDEQSMKFLTKHPQ